MYRAFSRSRCAHSERNRRSRFEILEDRRVLATVTVGELTLSGDFQNGVATGQVLVGFEEATPLIAINSGQVTADTAGGSFSVVPDGAGTPVSISLYALAANPVIWQSGSSNAVIFDASTLVTTGHSFTADGGTAEGVTVADLASGFFADNLALFDGTSGAADLVNLQGYLDFGVIQLDGLHVDVDQTNFVQVDSDTKTVTLTGVDAMSDDDFTLAGVEIQGELNVIYANSSGNQFSFGGSVDVIASGLAGGPNTSNLQAGLDLVVHQGAISSVDLQPSGSFRVWYLVVAPDDLTFEYVAGDKQFVMYGDAELLVPNGSASDSGGNTTSLTAQLGTASSPGLVIDGSGMVSQVDVSVYGKLNMLGFNFESPQSDPATFQYKSSDGFYELSGKVTAPNFWNAEVTMGTAQQPGVKIQNGSWSVDNLDVAFTDVELGAFEIENFNAKFFQAASTELDFDFDLEVAFPQSWSVDADIKTSFNEQTKLFEIDDVSMKASGLQVPIGETGLFLIEIDASIQNIEQPSDLIVAGDVTVEYGEAVKIFDESVRLFQARGGFLVDKDELKIDATVWLGALSKSDGKTIGLLGEGSGKLVLDWNDRDYSLDVKASLLDGVFDFEGAFDFYGATSTRPLEIIISAEVDLEVPHGIPLIGGDKLGSADFLFKYIAPDSKGGQADGFIAAWTRVDLIVSHVEFGIEYDFTSDKVKTIGAHEINALKRSGEKPKKKTYVYSQPFTNDSGATQATLSVDWSRTFASVPESAVISVVLPDGTKVEESNFAANGLSLITTSAGGNLGSEMQTHIGAVNPQADSQSYTGNLSGDSNLVTIVGATLTPAINGWAVSGAGIAAGATATYVNATTIKLSDIPTASAPGTELTFTNPYVALPKASGEDYTSYTLQIEFESESNPIDTTSDIEMIEKDPNSNNILIVLKDGIPGGLRIGDTVSISGSSVGGYNVSDTHTVTEITASGVVVDMPYTRSATGGKLSGWTLPQFNATYHLPRPTVLVDSPNLDVTSSELTVTMPVQVDNALAGTTKVDLYIDAFDSSLGANQDFKGVLLSKDVALGPGTQVNGQLQYNASTTVDLSQPGLELLPIEYYLYAVVNDGTNTPVTSTLTSNGSGGFNDVFDNVFAVSGSVTNQVHQDLGGWTVFVDANSNNILDLGEPSYVTSSDGFYGFYANQLPTGTPFNVVVNMLDSTAYTFDAPSLGIPAVGNSVVQDGSGLAAQVNWNGSSPVSADFKVAKFSVIEGVVTNASSSEPLSGWTVFLDANGNGQLDPGEGSTQTASNGGYELTNLLASSIRSISSSGSATSPTTVLNLAGAVPTSLKVGDTITVSDTSESAYNTTHTITAINATSIVTDQAFTATATGGLVVGPDVSETVALAIWNGSAATYAFALDQVQGDLVLDGSGGPNTQQHAGTLEGGATVGTATSFGVIDHPNAATDNQILSVDQASGAQFVSVNSLADLSPGSGAFSAAGWVRPDSGSFAFTQGVAGALGTGGGWALNLAPDFSFAPQQTFASSSGPASTAVGDFNGDNKPDIAVASILGGVGILLNDTAAGATTTNFADQVTITAGLAPNSISTGDFNGDGKLDIVVADLFGNVATVLINNTATGSTTLSFAAPQTFATGSQPDGLEVVDVDADGKPDLVLANQNDHNLSVLLNTTAAGSSTSSFAAQQTFDVGDDPQFVATADLNDDGKLDLAVLNGGSLSILFNTTAAGAAVASFSPQQVFDTGEHSATLAIGDLNGDTKPDLAIGYSEGSEVLVMLNTTAAQSATASFAASQPFAAGKMPTYVAIEDLNGDGKLDLAAVNNGDASASILLNTTASGAATASFASQLTFALGKSPSAIAFADFNGDMLPDLTAPNLQDNNVSVLLNDSAANLEVELVQNASSGSGSLMLRDTSRLAGDTWHHVAFTYDPDADDNSDGTGAGTVKLYVDGALAASSANRGSLPTSADISDSSGVSFNIGGQGGRVAPLDGYLDDVSLWDQTLSATQVLALYNGTTTPSYSQITPTNPDTYDVSLNGAFDLEQDDNFVVTELSSLAGSVFALPLQDEHLAVIAIPAQGWTVNLLDDQSQVIATTTSNALGDYQFAGLTPGTYRVELVLPEGWGQVSGFVGEFVLEAGEGIDGFDFVAAQLGLVNGNVYDDLNGNGVQDAGDTPRGGVIVYIDMNHDGQYNVDVEPATTTSEAGAYAFDGLGDGTYQLRLAPIAGRLVTGPVAKLHEITIVGGDQTTGEFYDFLTATNTPPIVDSLVTTPTVEGMPFSFHATWTDVDTEGTSTDVTINWGDGTFSTQTIALVNGQGSITAKHVYANGGFYDATLLLADGSDNSVVSSTPFTAIVTGVGIHDGVLEIVGTDEDDNVTVIKNGRHGFLVIANFLPRIKQRLSSADVTLVEVSTFAGEDSIRISGRFDVPVDVNGLSTDVRPGSLPPYFSPRPGHSPRCRSFHRPASPPGRSAEMPREGAPHVRRGNADKDSPSGSKSNAGAGMRGRFNEQSVDALFEELGEKGDGNGELLGRHSNFGRMRKAMRGARRR